VTDKKPAKKKAAQKKPAVKKPAAAKKAPASLEDARAMLRAATTDEELAAARALVRGYAG
jgi:hypothetical protein